MLLPPNCTAQPLQNLQIEMTSNTLSWWYELMVHQTVDVKQCNEYHFSLGSVVVEMILCATLMTTSSSPGSRQIPIIYHQ
jgi:hypothetical protein